MAEEDATETSLLLLETTAVGEERERKEAKRREGEQAHQPPPAESAEFSSTAAQQQSLPQISLSADTVHQAVLEISEGPKAAEPLPPLRGEGARCDMCSTDEPRYRCPGCHTRSCSLKCVKAHKERTGCDGQAPRSRFAPHVSELPENVLWHGEGWEVPRVCCKKVSREKTRQSWCASLTHVARVNARGAGRGGLMLRQTRGRVWSTTPRNHTYLSDFSLLIRLLPTGGRRPVCGRSAEDAPGRAARRRGAGRAEPV